VFWDFFSFPNPTLFKKGGAQKKWLEGKKEGKEEKDS